MPNKLIPIIFLSLFITACDKPMEYPKANGKVFNKSAYECIFGVLYKVGSYGDGVLLRDRNDKAIECTTIFMTRPEYERQK